MKQSSPTKPRLVIYVTPAELKAAKIAATKNALTTCHQFAAVAFRKALARGTP